MRRKMLGVSILIGLAVSGCKEDQPVFPVVKLCDYQVVDLEDRSKDQLFCTLTNGDQEWEQIIAVKDIPAFPATSKEKVVCTTLNNLTALRIFADNTQNWINNNCQK